MDLNHFHIQTKNLEKARSFYETYFEFKGDYVCDAKSVFLRNNANFFLGLKEIAAPEKLPDWFHFGFGLESEEEIRSLFKKMKSDKNIMVGNLEDSGDPMNFYCADPDGNNIEVYYKKT